MKIYRRDGGGDVRSAIHRHPQQTRNISPRRANSSHSQAAKQPVSQPASQRTQHAHQPETHLAKWGVGECVADGGAHTIHTVSVCFARMRHAANVRTRVRSRSHGKNMKVAFDILACDLLIECVRQSTGAYAQAAHKVECKHTAMYVCILFLRSDTLH